VLRGLIQAATDSADAPPGNVAAEIAHRVCRAGPQLLLRYGPDARDADAPNPDDAIAPLVLQQIRARLRKAQEGDWVGLVQDLLTDSAATAPMQHRATASPLGADGTLTAAVAQAATVKARNGSRKAAADLLIGSPAVPPGPATNAQVRALFRCAPLLPAERADLRHVVDAITSLPPKKRLLVSAKHVDVQITTQKAAAGPGPSGWRNSHITTV
jgi:hypothetical protein